MTDDVTIDEMRDKLKDLQDPKLVEKYGDPFDKNDIRNTAPTERRAKKADMTLEEEVAVLASDIEVLQRIVASMSMDFLKRKMAEQRKDSPLAAFLSDGGYL